MSHAYFTLSHNISKTQLLHACNIYASWVQAACFTTSLTFCPLFLGWARDDKLHHHLPISSLDLAVSISSALSLWFSKTCCSCFSSWNITSLDVSLLLFLILVKKLPLTFLRLTLALSQIDLAVLARVSLCSLVTLTRNWKEIEKKQSTYSITYYQRSENCHIQLSLFWSLSYFAERMLTQFKKKKN